jgi:hypothetical protein
MKTIMFAANLALTVLIAGAASAAEPDGPPGWYVEGHEALGTQGPFDGLECANALEIAKIALDRKFPGHGSWPLRCVYYTKYHYIVMEVPEDVGRLAGRISRLKNAFRRSPPAGTIPHSLETTTAPGATRTIPEPRTRDRTTRARARTKPRRCLGSERRRSRAELWCIGSPQRLDAIPHSKRRQSFTVAAARPMTSSNISVVNTPVLVLYREQW